MKIIRLLGFLCSLVVCAETFANTQPPLSNNLYQKIAKECKDLNLNLLKDDQKDFIEEHQFRVRKIQECNKGAYVIYSGLTRYDLTYPANIEYAKKFFRAFAKLNQKDKFAVVDSFGQHIFYVNVKRKPFSVSYTVES